jgi:hypothetical protein
MARLTVVEPRRRAVGEEAVSSFYRQGQGSAEMMALCALRVRAVKSRMGRRVG